MLRPLSLLQAVSLFGVYGVLLAGCGGASQEAIPAQSASHGLYTAASTPATAATKFTAESARQGASAALPQYQGCSIFTPGDYFNADISDAPVDAHSSNYLSSIENVDNTGFQPALGIEPLNTADDGTPLYNVRPAVAWHSFPTKYPWNQGFQIESASDRHYVAINGQTCHLYEAYGASFNNGTLSAYSGKDYDLRQPFRIGIGTMASGLSIFAGAVRHEEIASGIHHALNLDVWQNALCNCHTAPAAASDGLSYYGASSQYEMPYGAHLRLKASFSCSGWGPQSSSICTAMKQYGLYIADTDGHYVNNNKLFFVNPTDGGSWDPSDLSELQNLRFADFDVLTVNGVAGS